MSAGRRFASTLVVAEQKAGALNASIFATVTAAKAIGGEVSVLVMGAGSGAAATEAAAIDGVDKVLSAEDDAYTHGEAGAVTNLVLACQGANSYTHVLSPAANFGKNFVPRLAAKLDVAALTDVSAVTSEDTFVRPTYAGNAMATVQSADAVKVMTIRTTSFEAAAASGGSGAMSDAPAADATGSGCATFVSEDLSVSDRPDLTSAGTVIAGGRGMKNGENFAMLESLADNLGGAVGASRAAVDAGFVPNDMQIGQTGKVVAPDLYVAVGISGAIQHLAGMKDSKTIVAINKDGEAPIFQVADYGLVDDLFKAVPELDSAVAK
jgi:electron transfer flavoprotein alpha subunit